MSVLKIQVRGRYFDVEVSREGMFHTELNDETVKGESLAQLKDKLGKELARGKVKISIPFIVYTGARYGSDEREVRRGTITGKHAGNRNYLVRWDNGKTEQVSKWQIADLVPAAQEKNFLAVVGALQKAQEEYDFFITNQRIDLEKEVDEKFEKSA